MSQDQLIPVFPEAPLIPDPKIYIRVVVQYKDQLVEYTIKKWKQVSEAILYASTKLHFRLEAHNYWQDYNFFIGDSRINVNRKIGFYRKQLDENLHIIRVEDKPNPSKMADKLMKEYSFDEIKIMLHIIIDYKETADEAKEISELNYMSYLANESENDE